MEEGTIRLQYLGEVNEKNWSGFKGLQLVHAARYDTEYFPWKIAWVLVGYSGGCSDQESSVNLTGKCRQDCGVETRPLPWPSFEYDRDGWQRGLPPHQEAPTLLVNFGYSLITWSGCYIGRTRVSEFGGLIDGDATSYVHSREMTNGFYHASLWDSGGLCSYSWDCQWQLVLVNCNCSLGAVHSSEQWSPLKAAGSIDQEVAGDVRMVDTRADGAVHGITIISTGVSLFYEMTDESLASYKDERDGSECLINLIDSPGHVDFSSEITAALCVTDVNLLRISGHQVTILCAVQGYTSASTFLAILKERAKAHQQHTYMWAVIEYVQVINKQSSSHHVKEGRNRAACCDHSATATMVWSIQLLEFLGIGKKCNFNPTGLGVHCLDHVYYFDQVCADQGYYIDIFYDQVHISHDYYLGVFLEQVCVICYLNLVKVCLDYDICCNLVEVMKLQVPWDPGGSTRHRLEVKPKFKEGGMLATLLPGDGQPLLGRACSGTRWGGGKYIPAGQRLEDWTRNGRLRPPPLLSSPSSCSSSSLLLSVIAVESIACNSNL